MATRKPTRVLSKKAPRRKSSETTARQVSAVIGIALISLALIWFIWLNLRQANPGLSFLTFPMPGILAHNSAGSTDDPLAAAGITLTAPTQGQEPSLTRQQAFLLSDQLEPGIAARAGKADARYTLFSYKSPASSEESFHEVPVWLIHYTQVSEPRPDTAADRHASSTHHDFYVFLDAHSGKQLLAIWL